MDTRQFKLVKLIIVIVMGAGLGGAVALNAPLIVIAVWFAGLFALLVLRKRYVSDRVEADEMTNMIAGRAAYLTIVIASVFLAIVGIVLIAGRESLPAYEIAGYTMAYTSVGLLLLLYAFSVYFYRKMAE